jgi:predicted O-methyltransferase YrrM
MADFSAEEYVDSLYPADPDLDRALESIRMQGMPEISIERGTGILLTMLVRMTGAKRVLEIGALGGYSGICLARGLGRDGRLISLELKREYAALAHENLRRAGLGDRAEYRIGPALGQLALLENEGARFDLIFIDADKENYPNYLEWALRLSNPGTVIVGDDSLMHGRCMDESNQTPAVRAMRQYNRQAIDDPRLETVVLPVFDGLTLSRVK